MIERLYVHNFRRLENFTLDFAGQRSSVLIGKNGAGKSTLRHALRVFQSICRGPNRVKDVIRVKDFARFDKSRPMRFEIDVTLGQRQFKYAVSFEWPADLYEARIVEETLLNDGASVFTRQQGQVQLAGGAEFGLDSRACSRRDHRMSVHKYQPHLYVIPEDDADRQIADGLMLQPRVDERRVQVVAPAGGCAAVLVIGSAALF